MRLRRLRAGAEPDVLANGGEVGLLEFVAGHKATEDGLEFGSVIGLVEVGEFGDQDVVDEARRDS